ncbi:unnamed protein product [Caenorhabditis auriculariae]|uniref:Uncharacterized protein n=1 Tax=Caenorhabditis auriculariae TaxID=2777116 RepID=A0A8S1H286_9PELO|nr:unnamed protein product [Caenorhabditis auriculariae]
MISRKPVAKEPPNRLIMVQSNEKTLETTAGWTVREGGERLRGTESGGRDATSRPLLRRPRRRRRRRLTALLEGEELLLRERRSIPRSHHSARVIPRRGASTSAATAIAAGGGGSPPQARAYCGSSLRRRVLQGAVLSGRQMD